MDYHALDVLIDKAGQQPTRIDSAVVSLLQSGLLRLEDVGPLLDPLRTLSKALSDIQAWSTANQKPALPAGMVVADVGDIGDRQGHGPLRVADMTPGNWAAYQQLNLGPIWAQIFADNVNDLNAAIGSRPGDIATAEPDSTPFAPWLGKGQPV